MDPWASMDSLRLAELTVENFRSIAGRCVVPLDGAVTLIHGANGAGKTSLLSAIELAATGRVGFLDDQSGDTRSLLRNRDYPIGSVRLSLADDSGATRTGIFELNERDVRGNAVLTPEQRAYFVERSFLSQTALGRLLESYTETGKQVDTALVRFVKSLVGLDDLDALIDGLHAAGHLARSKKLVPAWSRAADQLVSAKERHDHAAAAVAAARSKLDTAVVELRSLLGAPEETDASGLVHVAMSEGRGSESSQSEQSLLGQLKATVDAVIRMRNQLGLSEKFATADQRNADYNLRAAAAYEAWQNDSGMAALATLNRIRTESMNLPAVGIGYLADAYDETLDRATVADRQHASSVAADRIRVERIVALDRRIIELDEFIAETEAEARAVDVSPDVRTLIAALQLTIPMVRGAFCPICDQPHTGERNLAEHLAVKLERLSDGAERLLEVEERLASFEKERRKYVGQVVLQKSLPSSVQGEAYDHLVRDLNRLADTVAEGARLRRNLEAVQARVAELTAREAERAVLDQRISEVADSLDMQVSALPDGEPEVALAEEIATRTQRARFADLHRERVRTARESVENAQREIARLEFDAENEGKRMLALKAQLSTAESRMLNGRALLQAAEKTRSRLINEVFDQSLNTLWAQLFSRFAPAERFTPRFVKQKATTRSVDVSLETQLPDGTTSGSPGAMLSYGNTNTAALSLFMALHLSAPTQLPWLIFDDPVQSMDEIHIANFAAIVRQLAYAHGRQVVIAIHQPELFEYLSLELAPATSAQSLVRVALERGAGTTTTQVERVTYEKEPLLRQKS